MAIYDAGGYKLVMRDDLCERAQLVKDGWTVIASGTTKSDARNDPVFYWLLAPPEPKPPTLAERLRGAAIKLHGESWHNEGDAALDAADALDHYALVEAAARKVVVRPHEKGNGVLVDNDLLWELADALNEGRKAPGADSL